MNTQREDGSWDEEEFTGTGFPKVFYLEYTYYRHYFPLLALGMFQRLHRHQRSRRKTVSPAAVAEIV
jgi:squalene cyclase